MGLVSRFKGAMVRHSAGATVVHKSQFEDRDTYVNDEELVEQEIRDWVGPFYMDTLRMNLPPSIVSVARDIPPKSVSRLLGDFNWRTRSMGDVYTILNDLTENEDQIINLLLKSEVCYSGSVYAFSLASIGTEKCVQGLKEYLSYYLNRKELYFDQNTVLEALIYLDSVAGTENHKEFIPLWKQFTSDKQNWELDQTASYFKGIMIDLADLKEVIRNENDTPYKLSRDEIKCVKEALKSLGWTMERGILYSPSESLCLNRKLFDTDRNDILAVVRKRQARLNSVRDGEEYGQLIAVIEKGIS